MKKLPVLIMSMVLLSGFVCGMDKKPAPEPSVYTEIDPVEEEPQEKKPEEKTVWKKCADGCCTLVTVGVFTGLCVFTAVGSGGVIYDMIVKNGTHPGY